MAVSGVHPFRQKAVVELLTLPYPGVKNTRSAHELADLRYAERIEHGRVRNIYDAVLVRGSGSR